FVLVEINHGLEHQLRIHVPFWLSVSTVGNGLEDKGVAVNLEVAVEPLVLRQKANEVVGPAYPIGLFEMNPEPFPVELPAKSLDPEVDILAVDEREVVAHYWAL